jgi:3-hydroxyacyl-CoA dehydrogenase
MVESTVSDGVCTLRLDAPNRNAISFAALEALRAAVARAVADPEVRGIVITGRPDHFSAGADIAIFRDLRTAEAAAGVSRRFQEAFQEIEDSPKPVAAAIGGRVMGGALELALACHYRVAARGSRFNMPEVTLGLLPGAGGTQRLPRLIGLAAALRMMLTAETIDAQRALDLGLIDAVCEPGELLAAARCGIESAEAPRRAGRLELRTKDPAAVEQAFVDARGIVDRAPAGIVGPARIVEAVRTGIEQSVDAGMAFEQRAFAECLTAPAAQNKIYLFYATRDTGKLPELAGIEPRPVVRAGVVGMGTMGSGIAQALAQAGIEVVAMDRDEAALRRGMERIRASAEKRVADGKLAPEACAAQLGRLTPTTRLAGLAGADLVIEAVYEDPDVKREVLSALEATCPAQTVLASNTSAISLEALSAEMQRPERLVAMHFFHPAQRMPLVEVARLEETDLRAVAAAVHLVKALGKTPVLVRDCPGFLVDRLFVPYLKEAFQLLEEGAEAPAIDAAMVAFGFPMGPLALIDMAGLDILIGSDRWMSPAYRRHGALSAVATRLADRDQLGQKTGGGVYYYGAGSRVARPSAHTRSIVHAVRQSEGRTDRTIGAEEITNRLVLRMVNEAFYALEEEIARCGPDIDVATVLGIGFPDYRGGVLRYAEGLGLDCVVRQLNALAERFGERFAPCELLRWKENHHGDD